MLTCIMLYPISINCIAYVYVPLNYFSFWMGPLRSVANKLFSHFEIEMLEGIKIDSEGLKKEVEKPPMILHRVSSSLM
ncbi:hypothetical protein L1887_00982 [Cichorium endivia]|nr:hypothetical protein L1887_00982 [Cichorium endivia]